MTCGELEILLCDYLDGALDAAGRQSVESHLATCPACAEMAADAQQAMSVIGRSAEAEPPAHLVAKILTETGSGRHGRLGQRTNFSWLTNLVAPLWQPRLVMGMAMTILSFSMMARCAGVSPRQLRAADLEPTRIWAALDDQAHRAWGRSVKYYEDIKLVYEIQSRIRDWTEEQAEEERAAAARRPVEERRVPAQPAKEDPAKTR